MCKACETAHDYNVRPPCTSDNCWSCEQNHHWRHPYERNIPGPDRDAPKIDTVIKISDLDKARMRLERLNQIKDWLQASERHCNVTWMASVGRDIKPDIATLVLKVYQKIEEIEDSLAP